MAYQLIILKIIINHILIEYLSMNNGKELMKPYKLILNSFSKVADNVYLYSFKAEKNQLIEPLFSLETAKLKIGNMERYYSVLNNPFSSNSNKMTINSSQSEIKFDFMMKDNPLLADKNQSFPYQIRNLGIGQYVEISYPFGICSYLGKSIYKIKNTEIKADSIVLLCSGTGLVPMYQLISEIYEETTRKEHTSKISLFYTDNDTKKNMLFEDDIKRKLDEINKSSNTLNFIYSQDNYHKDISNTVTNIQHYMEDKTRKNHLYLICGSDHFNKTLSAVLSDEYKINKSKISYLF